MAERMGSGTHLVKPGRIVETMGDSALGCKVLMILSVSASATAAVDDSNVLPGLEI